MAVAVAPQHRVHVLRPRAAIHRYRRGRVDVPLLRGSCVRRGVPPEARGHALVHVLPERGAAREIFLRPSEWDAICAVARVGQGTVGEPTMGA